MALRGGTKAKRAQTVVVGPEDWRTQALIRWLLAGAVAGQSFTKLRTVTQWNALLRKASIMAGLRVFWTAHCARAGWATENFLNGMAFNELREKGRWRSDQSLRIYLDCVSAMSIQAEPEVAAPLVDRPV